MLKKTELCGSADAAKSFEKPQAMVPEIENQGDKKLNYAVSPMTFTVGRIRTNL